VLEIAISDFLLLPNRWSPTTSCRRSIAISNPECRQYLLRQAFEEAVHTHTFQYIVESHGLDEGELFNMYREVPSITEKAAWALKHTKHLDDPSFKTGTRDADQAFLRISSPSMSSSKAHGFTPALPKSSRSAGATRWSALPSNISIFCVTNRST
jgi:Ribonucleotide reductase, small chain